MANLNLSYQNLYDEVSWFLGYTARGTSPTGDNLTSCKAFVDSGIRNFLYPIDERGRPHEWEFLRFYWEFATVPGQWKYALPIDFSEFCSDLKFDSTNINPPVQKRNAEQIIDMKSGNITTGYPLFFAIQPIKYDPEVGTKYELWVYPTPDQAYNLSGFYRADPIQLSATTDIIIGGVRMAEAILESCLAVAEHREDDMSTNHHTQMAQMLIQKLIKYDKITSTGKIGNLGRGDIEWPMPRGYLTYPDFDNNVY